MLNVETNGRKSVNIEKENVKLRISPVNILKRTQSSLVLLGVP